LVYNKLFMSQDFTKLSISSLVLVVVLTVLVL
jgi:hypothetical protein